MVCFSSATLFRKRRLPFLTPLNFLDLSIHFLHFTLAVAGVENVVELAALVDASSLSHGGVEKSASGRVIVDVTMIDSPPVGEHVAIVLMVEAGPVLTEEAVVMSTEVVVAVVVVAVLVETESSFFARLQAPASLSASAFLFSYANIKNKRESKAGNYASSGFVSAYKVNLVDSRRENTSSHTENVKFKILISSQ